MLLIISRVGDLHTDRVETACDRRGISYTRLCTREFPQNLSLSLNIDSSDFGGYIYFPDRTISLAEIQGIWYRRPESPVPDPYLEAEYQEFIERESRETLYGLYRALWDRRWVNPPHNDESVPYKIFQLSLAQEIGFQIPRTILSNNPNDVFKFFQECGQQMVYKLMHPLFLNDIDGDPIGIYTTLITADDIEEHLDSIRIAPCLFQELIPKQYELRVNVIGQHVWAAAIYSQEHDSTKVDYRCNIEECRHAPVLLPSTLETKCITIARHMGLSMCNIDMIVTPNNNYVFLEVNPNGQWAWIEERVGFPLTTALIDNLLGIDTLQDHPYLKHRSLTF